MKVIFTNTANEYRKRLGLDIKKNHIPWVSSSAMLRIGPGVGYTWANSVTQYTQCMHTNLPSRNDRKHPKETTTHLLQHRPALMHIPPRTNTKHQPSLLYALPMFYNFNPRAPSVSILCHVLRWPHKLHIASNNPVPTLFRTSSPSPTCLLYTSPSPRD